MSAPYIPVSELKGDLAGEWSDDNKEWNQMLVSKGVRMEYSPPERHHRTNPHAERQVGLIETVMKALMMQNNLAPQAWETCANSACWLLNRLPPIGEAGGVGIGSVLPRPLQMLSRGQITAATIDKELSYYQPPGTPALVHIPAAKGSSLGPKTRWGIADSMLGKNVVFRCPFNHQIFRARSFAAFKLNGLSWDQFLSLPQAGKSIRGPTRVPSDKRAKVTITLPAQQTRERSFVPPVEVVTEVDDDGVTLRDPTEAGVTQVQERGHTSVVNEQGTILRPAGLDYTLEPTGDLQDARRVPGDTVNTQSQERGAMRPSAGFLSPARSAALGFLTNFLISFSGRHGPASAGFS